VVHLVSRHKFGPPKELNLTNIRWSVGNVLGVIVVSQIGIATTDWISLWLAAKDVPVVSHLALGWQALIHLPSASSSGS